MIKKHRVIIADDHPIVRKGLRDMINATRSWHVIDEAANGAEALALYQKHSPDLIVLDVSMGEMSGLKVAEKILAKAPHARCIIMTMYLEPIFCHQALAMGVKGYLLKDDTTDVVEQCLTRAKRRCPMHSDWQQNKFLKPPKKPTSS